jgi:Concanavalin A-like lectin/glucanases superfamily
MRSGLPSKRLNQSDRVGCGRPGTFTSILTKAETYSLQFNGPRLEFTIMQNTVRKRLQAPPEAIAAGKTYHVLATYDGTTQRLYVNGTQVASAALSGPATTNANPLYIGSWDGTEEFFKGTIDEVAVYGSVLGLAQVAGHFDAGS